MVALGMVALTALAVLCLVGSPIPGSGGSSAAGAADGPLSWAPPAGWESYQSVTVPADGGTVTLRTDTDYRLVAPHIVRGAVILRGGRNVVWVGGHIRIDRDDAANGRVIPVTDRRGLIIDDGTAGGVVNGRSVYIEGLRIDGNDLSEGIDIKAPNADVYLQNIGIDTVRVRGFDSRDSTGAYAAFLPIKDHPDLIQPFGGYRNLRIDGLSGSTSYQGIFLAATTVPGPGGDVWLRRVDITAVQTPDEAGTYQHAGHRALTWYGNETGQIFIDPGTMWFAHHANSGWTSSGPYRRSAYRDAVGVVQADPVTGSSRFADNFGAGPTYPNTTRTGPYAPVAATDATGTFVTWSADATLSDGRPAVRDWAGTGPGRVYSGAPSGGRYVPLATVGLGYVSPGHQRQTTSTP